MQGGANAAFATPGGGGDLSRPGKPAPRHSNNSGTPPGTPRLKKEDALPGTDARQPEEAQEPEEPELEPGEIASTSLSVVEQLKIFLKQTDPKRLSRRGQSGGDGGGGGSGGSTPVTSASGAANPLGGHHKQYQQPPNAPQPPPPLLRNVFNKCKNYLKLGQSLDVTVFKGWFLSAGVADAIGDKRDPTANGWTMLHYAAAYNAPADAAQLVLNAGPESAKVAAKQGITPLHCAMKRGSAADLVAVVLSGYPAASKMTDTSGRTPLHVGLWNAQRAQAGAVKLVINAWPDATKELDAYGSSPLDSGLAKKAGG